MTCPHTKLSSLLQTYYAACRLMNFVIHMHRLISFHLPSFSLFFFFNDTATTEIYPLPLHDALPIPRNGPLQLGITNSWLLAPSEPQRDLEHDIPPSVRALEPAVPIPEGTFPCGEGPALERGAVEAFDAHQALGDLLPIGAHVLYRRAADRARNARQALDPCPAALHHVLHERVPIDAGAGAHLRARPVAQLHPTHGEANDESGEP